MHGRIKVRTTAEEKERKKKEQALKVRAYKAAMIKIINKRKEHEYDDEMLQITTHILQRNPDISTLWNIRRQCLEAKTKTLLDDAEQLQAAYDAELRITENCLMVNPKSYSAWHQRCWTLEHSPQANWERELHLCNKYLKLDERNFHTWDYRRYVIAKAGVEKHQELDYCTDLIKVNFSNYSSWHHRSLLLPDLYPYDGDALPKRPMNESKLKQELEMVITAAFTDPNDSSAWFYQRWLLGQSKADLAVCAFRCNKQRAVLAFTQAVSAKELQVHITDASTEDRKLVQLTNWKTNTNSAVSSIWHCQMNAEFGTLADAAALQLEINIPTLLNETLPLKSFDSDLCYFIPPNCAFKYSTDVQNELQSQLESCNSLLEFEPDSKWTLLTSALLMREIDPIKYHEQTMDNLKKLQAVDPLRLGYYRDLAAKWLLEHVLNDWCNSKDFPKVLNLIKQTELASLQYPQYLSIADEILLPAELNAVYANDELPLTFAKLG